jgi:hypothetical protein
MFNEVVRLYNENLTALPLMIEKIFPGQTAARKFERAMGFADYEFGKSSAITEKNNTIDAYGKAFDGKKPNGEAFNTGKNITERGLLAFMRRTKPNETLQQKEFDVRKDLIRQSIDRIREENPEKADRYQEAYDKLLKDSKNIQEVIEKSDSINAEAVNWWITEWKKHYDSLAEVSLSVYNQVLDKDLNYTPDYYAKVEGEQVQTDKDVDLLEAAFGAYSSPIYKKRASALMETQDFSKLPDGRYVSLDFESNNATSLKNALLDIKTAAAVRQMEGFMNSDSFSKIIPDEGTRTVLENRIKSYVRRSRGKDFHERNKSKNIRKFADAYGKFAAARALGSLSQPVKQVAPVAANTLVNAGDLNLEIVTNPDVRAFLDRSGYAIANRGMASSTVLDNIDRALLRAAETKGEKALDVINKMGETYMKYLLVNPDVFIARASWITYYLKNLEKQGVDVKNINWKTHEINQEAGDYAQQQVDRQQNISDEDLQGEFFASKKLSYNVARKMMIPFMNFVLNQKNRMYADLIALSDKTVSKEDKVAATRSLAGLGVEATVFSAISYAIYNAIYGIVKSALDYEEPEEEEKRRKSNFAKFKLANLTTDILSPVPAADTPILSILNVLFNSLYDEDVPQEERFQFYLGQSKGAVDDLLKDMGLYSIPIQKVSETADMIDMAVTGEYETEYFGKKSKRYISEEAQDAMSLAAFLNALYSSGFMPGEVGTVARMIKKISKKDYVTETGKGKIDKKRKPTKRRPGTTKKRKRRPGL